MCTRKLSITLGVTVALLACGKPASNRHDTGPGSASGSASGSGAGDAMAPLDPTAIAAGTTCPAGMQPIGDTPLTIAGARLSFTYSRGGGCPTRPVYTVLYTAADPTEVRVCYDQRADTCKMYIQDEHVNLDLRGALAAAGAASAVVGE